MNHKNIHAVVRVFIMFDIRFMESAAERDALGKRLLARAGVFTGDYIYLPTDLSDPALLKAARFWLDAVGHDSILAQEVQRGLDLLRERIICALPEYQQAKWSLA
jgi:hypothetical protein